MSMKRQETLTILSFGLNHYGSYYVDGKMLDPTKVSGPALGFGPSEKYFEKDGIKIGNPGKNAQPHDGMLHGPRACRYVHAYTSTVPWGFRKLLQYIHKRYTKEANIPIYITESGFAIEGESEMALEDRINDVQRQHYYAGYVKALFEVVRDDQIDIAGYMAWSLHECATPL